MVDHASRLALGWPVGERALTGLAPEAWEEAREILKAQGAEPSEMIFVSDQDPPVHRLGLDLPPVAEGPR